MVLKEMPYSMPGCFEETMGCRIPNYHHCDKEPISTLFGSQGVIANEAICYLHWCGIDDHRMFVFEVTGDSLFGDNYPQV